MQWVPAAHSHIISSSSSPRTRSVATVASVASGASDSSWIESERM